MEWRPIETAPIDGTHVLLWVVPWIPARDQLTVDFGCVQAGGWNSWNKIWCLENGDQCVLPKWNTPTHWMPLPGKPG